MNQDEPSPDSESADKHEPRNAFNSNVKSQSTWLRLFFMIVVILLAGVSRVVLGAVVVLQFFYVLFTGETNQRVGQLGLELATYTYQIIRYLTFNTEERPFPFDLDWPKGPPAL